MKNEYEKIIPQNTGEYLDCFNRMDYAAAFERYVKSCDGAARALMACGEYDKVSAQLVEYIDSRITGLWKRRKACDMKYFLMVYTVPMLLLYDSEGRTLASSLHDCWVGAHPDNDFGTVTHAELASGFNNTVLGFTIPGGGTK